MRKTDEAMLTELVRNASKVGLLDVLRDMVELLNEGDEDDAFGTEGWRHRLGWDE
jgi:hypothetical protein